LVSEEILGNRISSNIVLIGAIHAILGIGNQDDLEKALSEKWPRFAQKNIEVFRRGILLAKESLVR
jgi:Pyruvate/2-oxoacid:ferredoxin oxidoreductase gamma subunit